MTRYQVPLRLLADHRVGLVASAHSFPKWQSQRLLPPGFDTLQPGLVPGVSKLGPGFLLLFSIHTAAAFITAP